MHTKRVLAFCVLKDIDCIMGIGVHGTHQPSRVVCTDGDEAKVEWTSYFAHLLECRADGEVVLFCVVVFYAFEVADCSIPGVSIDRISTYSQFTGSRCSPCEVDLLPTRLDTPRRPQSLRAIKCPSRRSMLARQTTNATNNLCTFCGRCIRFRDLLGATLGRRQCQVALVPPIQFSHIIYTRFLEPRCIA